MLPFLRNQERYLDYGVGFSKGFFVSLIITDMSHALWKQGLVHLQKSMTHVSLCRLTRPKFFCTFKSLVPRPGGSVLRVLDSSPGGCEFETQLMRNFFAAYFHLSPLLKHARKVVSAFGKKFVLVLVWESQETHVRPQPPWCDLSC